MPAAATTGRRRLIPEGIHGHRPFAMQPARIKVLVILMLQTTDDHGFGQCHPLMLPRMANPLEPPANRERAVDWITRAATTGLVEVRTNWEQSMADLADTDWVYRDLIWEVQRLDRRRVVPSEYEPIWGTLAPWPRPSGQLDIGASTACDLRAIGAQSARETRTESNLSQENKTESRIESERGDPDLSTPFGNMVSTLWTIFEPWEHRPTVVEIAEWLTGPWRPSIGGPALPISDLFPGPFILGVAKRVVNGSGNGDTIAKPLSYLAASLDHAMWHEQGDSDAVGVARKAGHD